MRDWKRTNAARMRARSGGVAFVSASEEGEYVLHTAYIRRSSDKPPPFWHIAGELRREERRRLHYSLRGPPRDCDRRRIHRATKHIMHSSAEKSPKIALHGKGMSSCSSNWEREGKMLTVAKCRPHSVRQSEPDKWAISLRKTRFGVGGSDERAHRAGKIAICHAARLPARHSGAQIGRALISLPLSLPLSVLFLPLLEVIVQSLKAAFHRFRGGTDGSGGGGVLAGGRSAISTDA